MLLVKPARRTNASWFFGLLEEMLGADQVYQDGPLLPSTREESDYTRISGGAIRLNRCAWATWVNRYTATGQRRRTHALFNL